LYLSTQLTAPRRKHISTQRRQPKQTKTGYRNPII